MAISSIIRSLALISCLLFSMQSTANNERGSHHSKIEDVTIIDGVDLILDNETISGNVIITNNGRLFLRNQSLVEGRVIVTNNGLLRIRDQSIIKGKVIIIDEGDVVCLLQSEMKKSLIAYVDNTKSSNFEIRNCTIGGEIKSSGLVNLTFDGSSVKSIKAIDVDAVSIFGLSQIPIIKKDIHIENSNTVNIDGADIGRNVKLIDNNIAQTISNKIGNKLIIESEFAAISLEDTIYGDVKIAQYDEIGVTALIQSTVNGSAKVLAKDQLIVFENNVGGNLILKAGTGDCEVRDNAVSGQTKGGCL